MSTAAQLARMIAEAVPGWTFNNDVPGMWMFTDPDECDGDHNRRLILVDGRRREMKVLPEMQGRPMGPTVVGLCGQITYRVDLPNMTDLTDQRNVLDVLRTAGVLPPTAD